MKKLIFLLPLICTLNVFSQIEKPITKGNFIINGGGSIDYYKTTSKLNTSSMKQTVFQVSLNAGASYFVIDKLALGLNTSLGYYHSAINNTISDFTLGIGPTVRYYFGNGILLKGESLVTFTHGLGENKVNSTYLTLKPGIGYAFFINPKISLEPSLNYEFESVNYKETSTDETLTSKSNHLLIEFNIVIFL
jgi:hypothetical protein